MLSGKPHGLGRRATVVVDEIRNQWNRSLGKPVAIIRAGRGW
jgi:hypothetical protein